MDFSYSQLDVLKKLSISNYISEIQGYCEVTYPALVSRFKTDELRYFIEKGVVLAKKSGYTQRGPVRFYIDMIIMFGESFEGEPLYYWLKIDEDEIKQSQIERAVGVYDMALRYINDVYGDDGGFFNKSINNFRFLAIKTYLLILNLLVRSCMVY